MWDTERLVSGQDASKMAAAQMSVEKGRRGLRLPSSNHYDSIKDVAVVECSQRMLLSAGRDGVIKVWR